MATLNKVYLDRVIGRSSVSTSLASGQCLSCSSNGVLAYAAGCILVLRDFTGKLPGIETYLSLPRSPTSPFERLPGTPTQQNRKDSLNVLSFEDFAEPSKGKEKTKPIVSVSISPDARWLACGEQGQAPSICIWDMHVEDFQLGPSHIVKVHSYGVRHLEFSPASHFLVSIGYLHDGSIHVWDLRSGIKKVATNRVTANVHRTIWVGNKILTIGTRHVRIWQWKVEPICKSRRSSLDAHKESAVVLDGRNLILGDHVHSDFIAACALDTRRALVTTSQAVCFLDVDDKRPLKELFKVDYNISSISRDNSTVLIGDVLGNIHRYIFDECDALSIAHKDSRNLPLPTLDSCGTINYHKHHISAIFSCQMGIITTSEARDLAVHFNNTPEPLTVNDSCNSAIALLQCENDSYIIVTDDGKIVNRKPEDFETLWQPNLNNSSFTTANLINDKQIILGSTTGEVIYSLLSDPEACCSLRAHDGEVVSIAFDPSAEQILTFGRDKMVQLLVLSEVRDQKTSRILEVQQTFDEHTAHVTGAIFLGDNYILSSSVDRTLVLRVRSSRPEAADNVFSVLRIFDLRSAAIAIACSSETPLRVLVSCLDKSFCQLDIETGELKELCRTDDTYDLLVVNRKTGICCCVSSGDKSICLRSAETGAVLSHKGYGHIEKITSVQWSIDRDDLAITTSCDGLIIHWWFQTPEQIPGLSTPVRKIKPKAETLRLNVPRTSGTIRRSASVPRLKQTPSRPLSPSKLGIEARSPSPKRPTSGNSINVMRPLRIDCPSSPDVSKTTIGDIVAGLTQLKCRPELIDAQQREELRQAASWLFQRSPESTIL
ncbi:WD repeat protein [Taphrina deformans PYCC 5710]|uniref:WD repeat protein n=1 Tax=Taphrina deformans (strain PYCC 5710 / ATCC 11124 / CBS 356.35 / IMI 108563 / JCM 9778 / NBRC 8474) TaxID=1097556 RepID=R4XBB4_TAPDE|nr:WD repeat protein [Taphrina deformans PYCC 5710]|eukprot:CCG83103.1 WD repeat protein [Taphrina deformans PYCC 5710]